ncbi:MAG: class I SAM-dependent methyltransferase [Flavobacteriales bacterium]
MRNAEQWSPTKFVMHNERLRGSRDRRMVALGSRLMADLVARFYQEALPTYARGRLIDLGCGHVPLYASYKDHVDSVTCVDWGNSMHRNPYLDLEQDLGRPLAFGADAFDTILLSDVLEHIRHPERLMGEMHRILADGGHVIMNVPFYYRLHEQPFDFYRYTRFALTSMAEDAGFTVVSLTAVGGVPEILADLVAKMAVHVPLIGRPMAAFVQTFTAWLVGSGLGRKFSRRTSDDFPLGYAVVLRKNAVTA